MPSTSASFLGDDLAWPARAEHQLGQRTGERSAALTSRVAPSLREETTPASSALVISRCAVEREQPARSANSVRDHSRPGVSSTMDLRRDPRASIVICEHTPPYRGAEIRGSAQLITRGVDVAVRRIASRYLGSDVRAAYADNGADDLLIRLEPGDLRAWDFADQFS
jgi:hypothetical protein